MADFKITNNSFTDNASVIRKLYEAPNTIDFEKIEKELEEIKVGLKIGSPEFQVVDTLERSSRVHDWSAIRSAIRKFTSQFAGATLANLVGAYLSELLGLGH